MCVKKFILFRKTGRDLLTLNEAAAELKISRALALRLVREGILEPETGDGIGKLLYFDRAKVEKLRKEIADFDD